MTTRPDLSDAQRRVLQHIAEHMRAGFTGHVELFLKNGGVSTYRETRSVKPEDMAGPDELLIRYSC